MKGRAGRLSGLTWGRVTVVTVVVVCVAYAPIAMTELWPFAHPGAPAIGQRLMSFAVSPRYVAEAFATRIKPYDHSLIPLIVHSVLGGALMLLGPLQLLTAIRRRRRLHRTMGIVFAVAVYACMAAAAIYLARTPLSEAFGGAAFWIALAAILAGTVTSVTSGIVAVILRFPDIHQRWMVLCFGFLMSAPLLRIEWGVLPMLFPGLPMTRINLIATVHLGSLCAFGALVASRTLDRRPKVRGVEGTWVPRTIFVTAHVVGLAALVWIATAFLGWTGDGPRLLGSYLIPYAAMLAIMAAGQRRARREGRTWACEEWRIHQTALCLAPAFSVFAVFAFEHLGGLDTHTALIAGIAIGCGVLAVWATGVVGARAYLARRGVAAARRAPSLAVA